MRLVFFFVFFSLLTPLLSNGQKVVSIKIDGTINPVTAQFIQRGIKAASEQNAECLLIHLNTPGGLLKSTRVIVSDILESPVPVVVYVSPQGAHAGSAGVFITLAAHIAAMAPGTNIGAAHPVGLQGKADTVMNEKATNDAAAFVRTIAEKRNRNVEWAEQAVRKSVAITSKEALENRVIDLIAINTNELLQLIDGREMEVADKKLALSTRTASVQSMEMSTIEGFLDMLSDPNIAYVLMLLGVYGLFFELYSPGAVFPGVIGGISLILALYALHTLPINFAGLALIVFSVVLFILEVHVTSYGVLTIGGVVSLVLGGMMLIKTSVAPGILKVSWSVIIPSAVVTVLFFLFIVGWGLKAQRSKPFSEGFTGETGKALDTLDPTGSVLVHGEIWKATSVSGKIEKGDKIRVVKVEGLHLEVEHILNS